MCLSQCDTILKCLHHSLSRFRKLFNIFSSRVQKKKRATGLRGVKIYIFFLSEICLVRCSKRHTKEICVFFFELVPQWRLKRFYFCRNSNLRCRRQVWNIAGCETWTFDTLFCNLNDMVELWIILCIIKPFLRLFPQRELFFGTPPATTWQLKRPFLTKIYSVRERRPTISYYVVF